MSHVSSVKTSIKDLNCLKETLKELGLGYYENSAIQGRYLGAGQKVDLVIDNKGDKQIGMVKDSDGVFSFKGDFMSVDKKSFTEKIIQKYTVKMIRKGLNKMGISGISESVQENGDVKLVANF